MGQIGDIWNIGTGIAQGHKGRKKEREAHAKNDELNTRFNEVTSENVDKLRGLSNQALEDIEKEKLGRDALRQKYKDFSNTGLSEEAKSLYSDMAGRGMANTLQSSRSRRGGLMGMGAVNRTFLDSSRNLAMTDAEMKNQKMQDYLRYDERANNMDRMDVDERYKYDSMPLSYMMNRDSEMESRLYSENDAEWDYGRALRGAGMQNITSGINNTENRLEQAAMIALTMGMGAPAMGARTGTQLPTFTATQTTQMPTKRPNQIPTQPRDGFDYIKRS